MNVRQAAIYSLKNLKEIKKFIKNENLFKKNDLIKIENLFERNKNLKKVYFFKKKSSIVMEFEISDL